MLLLQRMNTPTFETTRLLLRPTNTEDASFVFELMNSPKWLQFIGDRAIKTPHDAANYIAEKIAPQFACLGYGNYTVIRKEDGVKMGSCGLYSRKGLEGIDLGFAFLPAFHGQGYAFEAAEILRNAAFHQFGLKELSAITLPENLASQKLLIRLGFSYSERITLPNDPAELMHYRLVNPTANPIAPA